MLSAWNRFLNNIHSDGQETSNQVRQIWSTLFAKLIQWKSRQVQNLGNKVLSEAASFDGREDFPTLINFEFRDLLANTRQYSDRFEGFLADIQRTIEGVIQTLLNCDRAVENNFEIEIANELRRAQVCVSL